LGISVTDETLQRSGCFLCESEASAANVLSVRQRQSAQSERKSTLHYGHGLMKMRTYIKYFNHAVKLLIVFKRMNYKGKSRLKNTVETAPLTKKDFVLYL